jgi:hypothetical protein
MQLVEILSWIESSALARFIAMAPLVYPTVSALHILGIALVFGSIVPVDLRLLKVFGPQFDAVLPFLVRSALFGFALAASTGVLLASIRIADYLDNPAFLTKMALLIAAGTNAMLLRRLSDHRDVVRMVGSLVGRCAAMTSLSLWICAVLAGRWIAFV